MCTYLRGRRAIAVLCGFCVLSPALLFADDGSLAAILAVWRKREADSRSVRVVTAEDYLTGKDTHIVGPPRDTVSKMRRVVVIAGNSMRHERSGDVWTHTTGATEHHANYAVFDGRRSKMLDETIRKDDALHSTGYVRLTDRHTDVQNIYLSPILRHFRPISPTFTCFKLDSLKVLRTDDAVNGDRCIVLEEKQDHKFWNRKYWIVPDKDMAVIRFAGVRPDGTTDHQVDTEFRKDARFGWIPSSWKAIRCGREGKVFSSASNRVTEIEVNTPIPDSTFDIEFPAGTEVDDDISKRRYIVKPDGTQRQIMQREVDRGASYSELVKTDTGMARPRAGSYERLRYWKLVVIASSLFIAAGFLVTWMRRHRQPSL